MGEEYVENGDAVYEQSRMERFRNWLTRVEKIYLEVLRAAALIFATGLLVWIGWLLISSTYKISRDPDAVETETAQVLATEMADIDLPEPVASDRSTLDEDESDSEAQTPYERFRDDYFAVFQQSFESFKQSDDSEMSLEEFEERYLGGFQRVEAADLPADEIAAIEAMAIQDELERDALEAADFVSQEDFTSLLRTMREAAELPTTMERLTEYRDTPKVRQSNSVRRTRQERYCIYYSDYYGECYSYGTRTVPYTDTVTRMVPADGVIGYRDLFGAYQDNYLSQLRANRTDYAASAASERLAREIDNAEGWAGYSRAVTLAAGFLAIMFFFLLIAIERHQRRSVGDTVDS